MFWDLFLIFLLLQPDDEKLDSVQLEFTYLLTSQLDSQRLYFEDKITRLEQQALSEVGIQCQMYINTPEVPEMQIQLIAVLFQTAELQEKASKALEENQKLQGKLLMVTRERQALDKKVQTSQ